MSHKTDKKRELFARLLKKKGLNAPQSGITPASRDANSYPLSFSQQQLWFLDLLEPGSPAYNIPAVCHFSGRLNIEGLHQSLGEIVRRHESLRTSFSDIAGQPVQNIDSMQRPVLRFVDLRGVNDRERDDRVKRLGREEALRPFELRRGPLLRLTLLRTDDQEYVLFLTMHHIISDGWSVGILMRELGHVFNAFHSGIASQLPELSIQYVDYAIWQQGSDREALYKDHLSYWRQKLKAGTILELPTDRPRQAGQTLRGESQSIKLDKELAGELKALTSAEGCTLFMTLLAAFAVLLHRYTGQKAIAVGTPVANRNQLETEELVGFFVNMLVLQTDLSGDPCFRDLLGRMRRMVHEAYTHQEIPFERLVEELQPERQLNNSPLFQVTFALQNAPMEALVLQDVTLHSEGLRTTAAKFDLSLEFIEVEEALVAKLEYNPDLYDATTINRSLKHLETLLRGIVAAPNDRLSILTLLTEAEQAHLLVEWAQNSMELSESKTPLQMVEEQAESRPDAIAIVSSHEQITYGELNRRANQLGNYLRRDGVGPEARVAIGIERSADWVIAMLGILKAGGVFITLDLNQPVERLKMIMQKAEAQVAVTLSALLDRLPETVRRLICLDAEWDEIETESADNLAVLVSAEHLAYAIFTSGSTGQPKGVEITNGGLANLIGWHQQLHGLTREVRASSVAALGFDASVLEIWPYLAGGCSIHLCDDDTRLSPLLIRDWLLLNGIMHCFLPTPLAERMLEIDLPDEMALRVLLTGGDRLHAHPRSSAPFELYNLYGPSENSVVTTCSHVPRTDSPAGVPDIGRPIWNSDVYLLDGEGNPVPVTIPGELCTSGKGLARGYLNAPELTAESFVPNPYGNPGARLYKTGDLARYRGDGVIDFLGRIDNQVKLRGFRVELGEIEAILRQHPAVDEAVVLAEEDTTGNKYLFACWVSKGVQVPSSNELRRFLLEKLPGYMIPALFQRMEELPLTANGKVDRRAISAVGPRKTEQTKRFVAPRSLSETILAEVWGEILSTPSVGVEDNFFELGGHSLLATQVVMRLRDALGIELPVRSLFEMPTLAALAQQIDEMKWAEIGLSIPRITPVLRSCKLPLSFAQQRIWLHNQMDPDDPFYNIAAGCRIKGRLNAAALHQSLNEIVRRHEALRTSFTDTAEGPVQSISEGDRIRLAIISLKGIPETDRQREVLRLGRQEARRTFDLGKGPLLRLSLIQLNDEENLLLLTMHHIIGDEWSINVLINELTGIFGAYTIGSRSPLSELTIQYGDFAVWQRDWLQGNVLDAELKYWAGKLNDGVPTINLPTDRPNRSLYSFEGASLPFLLSKELSERLKEVSRRSGTTLFMTLLAGFNFLLSFYSSQRDISVGTPISNRNVSELEELIGFIVNTLVLRVDLNGEPTFRELIERVRQTSLEAFMHQHLPYEKLVELTNPGTDFMRQRLFQVMFVMQEAVTKNFELSGLELTPFPVDNGTSKFDLTLAFQETDEGLAGSIEYDTGLFDATTIRRMAGHLESLLEVAVTNPDTSLSDLPLLSEPEHHQMLREWNDSEQQSPDHLTIPDLFYSQASSFPDRVAVVFEDQCLSYAELNRRANQLARYLVSLGVGPDVCVGICLDRSVDMILAILATLKAGGAYVPIDPLYPSDRISFILEDASISVLLSHQHLLDGLPSFWGFSFCMDADWQTLHASCDEAPDLFIDPDNLAYIIYTSGSTGSPNGAPDCVKTHLICG